MRRAFLPIATATVTATALAVLTMLATAPSVSAHACYLLVNETATACPHEGPDGAVLAAGLTASPLVPMALAGLLAAPFLIAPARRAIAVWRPGTTEAAARGAAAYARDYLPLLLRLGLGATLVGQGLVGRFVSPLAPNGVGYVAAIVGGFIIAGFATRWAALAALGLFGGALWGAPHLVGNAEAFVMAALLAFRLPAGRPSVDDWLATLRGTPARGAVDAWSVLALRFGLAAALAFGAFSEKLLDPHVMLAVAETHGLAGFMGVPAEGWVVLIGAVELAFAVALAVGFETRLTAVALFASIVFMTGLLSESVAAHATLLAAAGGLALTGARSHALVLSARLVKDVDAA